MQFSNFIKKIYKRKKFLKNILIILFLFLFIHFFMPGGLTPLGYKII